MNKKTKYDELHESLTAALRSLPPRACGIVIALAAYRTTWEYRMYELAGGVEGMSKVMPILDEIFNEVVVGGKPDREAFLARCSRLHDLTRDSEEGDLASGTIAVCSLINAAQTRHFKGDASSIDQEPDSVFEYLAGPVAIVGGELFNCSHPGTVNPQFTELFYDKVLADPRCIRAVEWLRNDIEAVSSCSTDYASIAYTLRDKALTDANEILERERKGRS